MELIDAFIDMTGNEIDGKILLHMLGWESYRTETLYDLKKDMNTKASHMTLQRHLTHLISIGYVDKRRVMGIKGNPLQYKINLDAIRHGLELIGCHLIGTDSGYTIEEDPIILNELPIDID